MGRLVLKGDSQREADADGLAAGFGDGGLPVFRGVLGLLEEVFVHVSVLVDLHFAARVNEDDEMERLGDLSLLTCRPRDFHGRCLQPFPGTIPLYVFATAPPHLTPRTPPPSPTHSPRTP